MDRIVGIVEARSTLPAILKGVSVGKRYVITQRSHARAVIISLEDLETLEVQADKALLEDIKAAKEDIRKGRVVSAKDYFARSKTSRSRRSTVSAFPAPWRASIPGA